MRDPTRLTEAELAEMEARASASTPGPNGGGFVLDTTFLHAPGTGSCFARFDGEKAHEDSHFFNYARGDVLRLIAEVRRLRQRVDELEDEAEQMNHVILSLQRD